MDFIDLAAQHRRIAEPIESAIHRVLARGDYIGGEEVRTLEHELAAFCAVDHCVSCANGTDALQLALMAIGVGGNDEVIVPSFSYVATAEAVTLLGARPVYVDVQPDTYNVDPVKLENAWSERTRAIVPVSLYGQCADFDDIVAFARERNIVVIEDAAQSFGATYKGRRSAGIAEIGCTSFYPAKPLGCYGDGGAVFTNDTDLAGRIRQIAEHGQTRRYHHKRVGINSRLDTIQAAILLVKLSIFADELHRRQTAADHYSGLLAEIGVTPPFIREHNTSAYAQYTIELDARDDVHARMAEHGVPTAVHYPLPLHKQPAVSDTTTHAPVSERAADRVLSLPMHPYLTDEDCQRVVETLSRAL